MLSQFKANTNGETQAEAALLFNRSILSPFVLEKPQSSKKKKVLHMNVTLTASSPLPPPFLLLHLPGFSQFLLAEGQRPSSGSATQGCQSPSSPPPPNPEPPPCSQALGFLHCPNREPWCRDREDHGNVGMRTDIKEESGKGEGIKGRDD